MPGARGGSSARFAEHLRLRAAAAAADRHVARGPASESIAVLRRLRRDVVADAVRRVRARSVGVVWPLPLSETSRLFATSRCVRPTCCGPRAVHVERAASAGSPALVHAQVDDARDLRRASCSSVGGERAGWPRWLRPTTWTSIGAGSPKFRIWLTMSAGRKENCDAGKLVGQARRAGRARSPRSGRGPARSDTRMSRVGRRRSAPSCCTTG